MEIPPVYLNQKEMSLALGLLLCTGTERRLVAAKVLDSEVSLEVDFDVSGKSDLVRACNRIHSAVTRSLAKEIAQFEHAFGTLTETIPNAMSSSQIREQLSKSSSESKTSLVSDESAIEAIVERLESPNGLEEACRFSREFRVELSALDLMGRLEDCQELANRGCSALIQLLQRLDSKTTSVYARNIVVRVLSIDELYGPFDCLPQETLNAFRSFVENYGESEEIKSLAGELQEIVFTKKKQSELISRLAKNLEQIRKLSD